jgi:hypothetical protein
MNLLMVFRLAVIAWDLEVKRTTLSNGFKKSVYFCQKMKVIMMWIMMMRALTLRQIPITSRFRLILL